MSLFTKLFEAVHSWRRRRGGAKKPRKRSDLAMEQLDHRQLLAVNFTGNVPIDFPATQNPGVVVVPSPTSAPFNQTPQIPPNLAGVVKVTGFQIDDFRVSYDPTSDILSVGVEGPLNGITGQQVIAGDSDNNLNSGTVNPIISSNNGLPGSTGIDPTFQDPPDMGGTKTYAVTFNFVGTTVPQVVAGFPQSNPPGTLPNQAKVFEVAGATVNPTNPTGAPLGFNFDQQLPQFTGSYFLANDPNHPNFEFQIDHFSQLYQLESGKALSSNSTFGIGGFGTNNQNIGISDEFFPIQQGQSVALATPPTPPPPPPPPPPPIAECSPTIYVNPHENNHLNTAHPTAIRVTVLGSSGFDPTTLIPSTVKFGDPATIATTGASPILNYESNVNHDEFPDETFVFNGLTVNLPSGVTTAEITGQTTSGLIINSQVKVFNRDDSYYPTAAISAQQKSWLAYDKKHGIDTSNGAVAPPPVIPKAAQQRAASAAINDLYGPFVGEKVPKQVNATLGTAQAASVTPSPAPAPVVVSIPTKHGKASKTKATPVSYSTVSLANTSAASMSLSGSS